MKTKPSQKAVNIVCFIIFIIYISVVLKLTIFRSGVYSERRLNLSLFTALIKIYRNAGLWRFLRLFLGNVGCFVPFGFLLPILYKKANFVKVAALSFLFSFGIETTQYFSRKGIAELDDLILNVFGAVVGYLLYKLLCRIIRRRGRDDLRSSAH